MDAENAENRENELPKCKLIIKIAAPIVFMLVISIYVTVVSTNGTELGTNDIIGISVILSLGALWVFGTILWYLKCCCQEFMKTVITINQKKAHPNKEEIRTNNGLSPNSGVPRDENNAGSETTPLCNDGPSTTTNTTAGD